MRCTSLRCLATGSVLALACLPLLAQPTGPWNNPLMTAVSADGIIFASPEVFQDSAGVPSLVRWHGDTLVAAFQWFRQPNPSPTWDRVAIKLSTDLGQTWSEPVPALFPGLPAGFQRPFDPTLAVTPDGRLRMYFSSSAQPPMGLDSTVNTYSAISQDGLAFQFEPGARVDVAAHPVIDPAVIRFKNLWHYTAPAGAPQDGARHYTGPDGLLFFEAPGIPSDANHNWTGNLMQESDSLIRFYGAGPMGIWYAQSPNGGVWSPYTTTNLKGGDPTVLKTGPGQYRIIYVGPPGTTGVAEVDPLTYDMKVIAYPTTGSLLVTTWLPPSFEASLQVVDLSGQILRTASWTTSGLNPETTRLTLSKWTAGPLIVSLEYRGRKQSLKVWIGY